MSWIDSYDASRARSGRHDAFERVKAARGKLSALQRDLAADLDAARRDQGDVDSAGQPLLSAAGIAEHQNRVAEQARANHRRAFEELQSQMERDAKAVLDHASSVRPKHGVDAAAAQRQLMKWQQVQMRLEAGMPLRTVVAGAEDVDTLLAVREWAPAWLEAQAYSNDRQYGVFGLGETWQAPDTTALMRSIDDRLAATVGGEVGEALEAAREVDVEIAGWTPTATYVGQVLDGVAADDGGLRSAVTSHYARQEAKHGIPTPEPADDASSDDGPAAA